jgi:UDPglucose--hexose-1-phosphate uridylyltransferase
MPELRHDPIVDRTVIIAPGRADRPREYEVEPSLTERADCPFCRGQEEQTPPASLTIPAAGDGPWRVRVVPNKYPALSAVNDAIVDVRPSELFASQPVAGGHEVVIESPRHVTRLGELSVDQWSHVLSAYQQRLEYWRGQDAIRYVSLFKNAGLSAGATLSHVHSQLIALPFVPRLIREELAGAETYFAAHQHNVFEAIVAAELADGRRIVKESDAFVAFCPFASRFSYETWVVPRAGVAPFERLDGAGKDQLAELMLGVLIRLEKLLGAAGYNYYLHTTPFDRSPPAYYHWHLEICPRQAHLAGFELGSATYINPVPPEHAARHLRSLEG